MIKTPFDFNNSSPGATVLRRLNPLTTHKPRTRINIHTYGGETPFFKGLSEGRLMATKCSNSKCNPSGKPRRMFVPPRVYCPNCLEKMQWSDITDVASKTATIHSHISVANPNIFNSVPAPCELISVKIEGVSTIILSQFEGTNPEIGMAIRPKFMIADPTYTILDLSWISR